MYALYKHKCEIAEHEYSERTSFQKQKLSIPENLCSTDLQSTPPRGQSLLPLLQQAESWDSGDSCAVIRRAQYFMYPREYIRDTYNTRTYIIYDLLFIISEFIIELYRERIITAFAHCVVLRTIQCSNQKTKKKNS